MIIKLSKNKIKDIHINKKVLGISFLVTIFLFAFIIPIKFNAVGLGNSVVSACTSLLNAIGDGISYLLGENGINRGLDRLIFNLDPSSSSGNGSLADATVLNDITLYRNNNLADMLYGLYNTFLYIASAALSSIGLWITFDFIKTGDDPKHKAILKEKLFKLVLTIVMLLSIPILFDLLMLLNQIFVDIFRMILVDSSKDMGLDLCYSGSFLADTFNPKNTGISGDVLTRTNQIYDNISEAKEADIMRAIMYVMAGAINFWLIFYYMIRDLTISFLFILAPLIVVLIPYKTDIFWTWLKEMASNIFSQSIQALILVVILLIVQTGLAGTGDVTSIYKDEYLNNGEPIEEIQKLEESLDISDLVRGNADSEKYGIFGTAGKTMCAIEYWSMYFVPGMQVVPMIEHFKNKSDIEALSKYVDTEKVQKVEDANKNIEYNRIFALVAFAMFIPLTGNIKKLIGLEGEWGAAKSNAGLGAAMGALALGGMAMKGVKDNVFGAGSRIFKAGGDLKNLNAEERMLSKGQFGANGEALNEVCSGNSRVSSMNSSGTDNIQLKTQGDYRRANNGYSATSRARQIKGMQRNAKREIAKSVAGGVAGLGAGLLGGTLGLAATSITGNPMAAVVGAKSAASALGSTANFFADKGAGLAADGAYKMNDLGDTAENHKQETIDDLNQRGIDYQSLSEDDFKAENEAIFKRNTLEGQGRFEKANQVYAKNTFDRGSYDANNIVTLKKSIEMRQAAIKQNSIDIQGFERARESYGYSNDASGYESYKNMINKTTTADKLLDNDINIGAYDID